MAKLKKPLSNPRAAYLRRQLGRQLKNRDSSPAFVGFVFRPSPMVRRNWHYRDDPRMRDWTRL